MAAWRLALGRRCVEARDSHEGERAQPVFIFGPEYMSNNNVSGASNREGKSYRLAQRQKITTTRDIFGTELKIQSTVGVHVGR